MGAKEENGDGEMDQTVKKYLRGEAANLEGLQDKKLKGQLAIREELYGKSAKAAAKIEKWLLPSEGGYLEAEGIEKTWRIKQESIAREVDILSLRNQYDIVLPELGPYTLDFTPNGRYMAAAGRKGHLAVVDMKTLSLIKEIQVRETVRDVVYLHNELFFAAAQKKYPYIYNRDGTELHCLKEHGAVSRLQFLKNHFLLASINKFGQLHYQDVTMGEMVGNYRTGSGRTDAMQVNPFNGVVALGHSSGTVTMWKPTSAAPLVKMLCHPGPVSSLAFHPNGHLMATSGKEKKIKIWDLRKFEVIQTLSGHAKTLNFSQKGLLAAGTGSFVQILGDFSGSQNYSRYMSHSISKGYQVGKVLFRPYEDVLGIGHSMGWSSILVPGSGEPNFDSWVANPFETSKQRREKEVHSLLDKLPPETIMLDPTKVGTVRPARKKEKPTKEEREAEMEAAVEAAKDTDIKKKTKGRNKPSKRAQRRKEIIDRAKRPFLEHLVEEQETFRKKQKTNMETEMPKSLQRFVRQKAT
ncbi:WD40 repeat - like 10 [Theobroma cacao]|nr:WD40 repeat - like 10 [Theobroma cacao]